MIMIILLYLTSVILSGYIWIKIFRDMEEDDEGNVDVEIGHILWFLFFTSISPIGILCGIIHANEDDIRLFPKLFTLKFKKPKDED